MAETGVPVATYRFQFNKGFTFRDARPLVPYLQRLGISHLYASPIFKARSGSAHGYDVTDPSQLNPELGTEADFQGLVQELQAHGMGLLLDIVPNHMAASLENPWWADVLENGPASPHAGIFDIDWNPPAGVVQDQVLLPVLGQPYHQVLESGDLALRLDTHYDPASDSGLLSVQYYDLRLPLEVGAYGLVLAHRLDALERQLGANHPAPGRLRELLGTIADLPPYYSSSPEGETGLRRTTARGALSALVESSPEIKAHLEENIALFNGKKGEPHSFDLLEQLLARQPYRLAFWETGRKMFNYRRFFDITDLAGVRAELPEVFEATHSLVLRLVSEGQIDGLRIDHVDGLRDPAGYLERLQERLAASQGGDGPPPGFYVVVEKILSGDETLPGEWPVAGTTGYEFLNVVNRPFVDQAGYHKITQYYKRVTSAPASFDDVVYEKKKQVIADLFIGEVQSLGHHLGRLAWQDRYACDLPPHSLTQALVEVTACLRVYRTYTRTKQVSPVDRRYIEGAVQQARSRAPALEPAALDFVQRVLLLDCPSWFSPEQKEGWRQFIMRWQQFTGPAMAKGFEDTALYTYNPLISLNDVGGDPAASGGPEEFHRFNSARQSHWPHTLNATSTHDTKRSEDVRARIDVLSEIPEEWQRCLNRWRRWNRPRKRELASGPGGPMLAPDVNTEIMLYQSLIGVWLLAQEEAPGLVDRLKGFVVKTTREAKVYTSWLSPEDSYEQAITGFVEEILEDSPENRFLPDFLKLQRRVAYFGALNSLAQTLLKIAAPGAPDFYQGTELWDFSLVDPDNRRPVDFEKRVALLDSLAHQRPQGRLGLCRQLLGSWEDGRAKLYVIYRALNLRQERRQLFQQGDYIPLHAQGHREGHIFAFARRHEHGWVLVAVPRLVAGLASPGRPPLGQRVWGDSGLLLPDDAPGRWNNIFTDEVVTAASPSRALPLAEVFGRFPVALLVG